MKKKLGVITIGQSPREDIIEEMRPYLGNNVEIIEVGALDGLTYDEVLKLKPTNDDYILITKLKDGTQVKVAEQHIIPLMQLCIDRLEAREVDLILIICTGAFPEVFVSSKSIIYPQKLLHGVLPYLVGKGRLAVVTPDEKQIEISKRIWGRTGADVSVIYGSPYVGNSEIDRIVNELSKIEDIDIIVLDCMGYSKHIKDQICKRINKPVILSRSLVARILGEMLG